MSDHMSDRLPIATGRRTAAILWQELRGRRRLLLASGMLAAAGAALELVTPAVLGRIVDDVADGGAHSSLWLYGLLIALSAVAAAVVGVLGILVAARVMERLLAGLREKLIASALFMPQQRVERSGTGDLISRASDDVAQVSEALSQVIPSLTRMLFTIVLTVVGMALLDWRLAIVLLVAIPLYWWSVRWYLRIAPPMYAAERAAFGDRAHVLLSSLRGLPTVLAYRLTGRHSARIAEYSWTVNRWALRARTVQTMFMWRVDMAFLFMLTVILLIGFALVGNPPGSGGALTIGAVTTAVLFFLRIETPLRLVMQQIDILQSATASLARIIGVTDSVESNGPTDPTGSDEVMRSDPAGDPNNLDGSVTMDQVTFSYDAPGEKDSAPVLHDLTLSIADGEHIALVGTSGAGKTTVASLLAGIHPVTQGTLRCPARTVLISQETHIFAGTLRENLTLGLPNPTTADDNDLVEALTATGAADLLDLLPHGLDTPLGPRGYDLTAAQSQHLSLTRALIAEPALVILDEATAEAGSAHADILDRAAEAVLVGRTGVVIAHRLSQAASCDRIIVMEHGRIVESGSQESLVLAGGVYARLWDAWSTAQGQV